MKISDLPARGTYWVGRKHGMRALVVETPLCPNGGDAVVVYQQHRQMWYRRIKDFLHTYKPEEE